MISLATARGLVTSAISSNGFTLSPEDANAAAERIAADVDHDATGALSYANGAPFRLEAGNVIDVPIGEHLVAIVREYHRPESRKAAPAEAQDAFAAPSARPTPGTAVSDFGKALAAAEEAKIVSETKKWPNPWIAGPHYNRTRQNVIRNTNPGLAVKFKAQSGV